MGCFGVANRSSERREDAGAIVSHEQVKSGVTRYPVDRYLVESSNKIEMVNITDDEIWKTEPVIRPEDEAVLRKLHEMLQSTADDLKLISGELTKCREPRKQVQPTPLDEEFNEKVHIEEIVNAKFHGYHIADKPSQNRVKDTLNTITVKTPIKPKPKTINASVQVNQVSTAKKVSTKKNLTMSRTRLLQIDEQPQSTSNNTTKFKAPSVTYNEYAYKHEEQKHKISQEKPLNVQTMPSINIRGELKQQKVLQLDIIPEQKTDTEDLPMQSNVAVIAMQYELISTVERQSKYPEVRYMSNTSKPAVRKVSTMLTCESSESSDNASSQAKLKARNLNKSNGRPAPKHSVPLKSKFTDIHNKTKMEKPFKSDIDEWRKKINTIYGGPSTSKKPSRAKSVAKVTTKSDSIPPQINNKSKAFLNNAEYIPYTKLTLGGLNVSDIEREISDLTDKNVPLSPILDKILISRENSFHESASKKDNKKNILTTSDENLLEEVLDIQRDITTTLNKNLKGNDNTISNISSESNQSGKSYADDFEEERSDNDKTSEETKSKQNDIPKNENVNEHIENRTKDTIYTKSPKLNFKNTVDVFEFIHSIDRQDNATQSNCSHKISLKSTQTSPRNVQPIRNELWPKPSAQTPIMNPSSDVGKVLNEDLIKKLIVDECTDILQKNLSRPTTSKDKNEQKNVVSQKKTQTSPAHVKSVMTSPTRTKTRMTSPRALSFTVDHQTSPIDFQTNADNLHIELDKIEDLAISINLSSPRFSLRLPRDSREVLSNLESTLKTDRKVYKPVPVKYFTSSSSADADYSSDISSLGEINNKLKRRPKRTKYPSISESTSSTSKYSSDVSSVVLPLKSEGEISLGQVERKNKLGRSDGEMSLGLR